MMMGATLTIDAHMLTTIIMLLFASLRFGSAAFNRYSPEAAHLSHAHVSGYIGPGI